MSSIPRIELSMSCHMLSWIAGVLRKLPEIFMALRQHPLRSHPPLALAALAFLFHGRPRRNEAGSETSHLMPNKAIVCNCQVVLWCFIMFCCVYILHHWIWPGASRLCNMFIHTSIIFQYISSFSQFLSNVIHPSIVSNCRNAASWSWGLWGLCQGEIPPPCLTTRCCHNRSPDLGRMPGWFWREVVRMWYLISLSDMLNIVFICI